MYFDETKESWSLEGVEYEWDYSGMKLKNFKATKGRKGVWFKKLGQIS